MKNLKKTTDNLSNLPDALIHQIFTFMNTKSVIQTSLLSKRYKSLYKSSPAINLHLNYYPDDPNRYKQPKFLTDIQTSFTLLNHHKQSKFISDINTSFTLLNTSALEKITLSSHQRLYSNQISEFINQAVFRRISELDLSLMMHDPIELPRNLFDSVRDLSLQNCLLKDWEWVCEASRVRKLRLVSLNLPDGDSKGCLRFTCCDLESLTLMFCGMKHVNFLDVNTPKLKNLVVNTAITCETSICCPVLVYLSCSAFIEKRLCFSGDFSEVVNAVIDIHPYDESERVEEVFSQSLSSILLGMRGVKCLTLKDFLVKEIISYHPDLFETIPSLFRNLMHISLKDWDGDVCINALVNFFQRLPHMETLVWVRSQNGCSLPKMESHLADTSNINIFHCLKTFEIRDPQLAATELVLIELLLKRAIVLKEVVVKTTCTDSLHRKKLAEFEETVLAFSRISSTATVSFGFNN